MGKSLVLVTAWFAELAPGYMQTCVSYSARWQPARPLVSGAS
jgi:hypothetical protein